jgi:hypothetical protein
MPSLLAGIGLLMGEVHACIGNRHRWQESVEFLKHLDAADPTDFAPRLNLDSHPTCGSNETKAWRGREATFSTASFPESSCRGGASSSQSLDCGSPTKILPHRQDEAHYPLILLVDQAHQCRNVCTSIGLYWRRLCQVEMPATRPSRNGKAGE